MNEQEDKELSPVRKRSREKKTQRILRVAMDLVKEEGVDGLTIHRLANELDVTVGALYRYFASKDELVVMLQCDGMAALRLAMQEVRDVCGSWMRKQRVPEGVVLLTQCVVWAEFYGEFARVGSAHYRLLSLLLGHPEPLVDDREATHVMDVVKPIFADIAAHLDSSVQVGVLRPDNMVERALVLWSSLYGLLQVQKVGRLAPMWMRQERLLRQLMTTLLLGWGATPEAVEKSLHWSSQFRDFFPYGELATLDKYSAITGNFGQEQSEPSHARKSGVLVSSELRDG